MPVAIRQVTTTSTKLPGPRLDCFSAYVTSNKAVADKNGLNGLSITWADGMLVKLEAQDLAGVMVDKWRKGDWVRPATTYPAFTPQASSSLMAIKVNQVPNDQGERGGGQCHAGRAEEATGPAGGRHSMRSFATLCKESKNTLHSIKTLPLPATRQSRGQASSQRHLRGNGSGRCRLRSILSQRGTSLRTS